MPIQMPYPYQSRSRYQYNHERYGWCSSSSGSGSLIPAEWVYVGTTNGIISDTFTTSGTTTMNNTWDNWGTSWVTNRVYPTNHAMTVEDVISETERTPTPEETERVAAALERAEEDRVAREQARAQARTARAQAHSRAESLLCELLPEDQRDCYRLHGFFEIIGSHGTVYRVYRGSVGNVAWLRPDGQEGGRLCAHPNMRDRWLPDPDVALAQLLALTTDERAFVSLANVHSGYRPPVVV